MDKLITIFHYHTSMAVSRNRKNKGMINDDALMRISVMLANKYGLPLDRYLSGLGLTISRKQSQYTITKGKSPVDKLRTIFHYHASMAVFRSWKNEGMINNDDLMRISVMLANKYGLPLDSIYLDRDLLYLANRANIQ